VQVTLSEAQGFSGDGVAGQPTGLAPPAPAPVVVVVLPPVPVPAPVAVTVPPHPTA